jgi:hypothetical protein
MTTRHDDLHGWGWYVRTCCERLIALCRERAPASGRRHTDLGDRRRAGASRARFFDVERVWATTEDPEDDERLTVLARR